MTNGVFAPAKKIRFADKVRGVVRLSRWREHVPYTIPLVICGAMLAVHLNGVDLNWRLVPVILANILSMSFAFMINDIADAHDDARSPWKRARNVISNGTLTETEGYFLTGATFITALLLYSLGGWKTFGAGGLILVLSYLYSAPPFRLKARPIVDILSHILMLSGLIIVSGYFVYATYPGAAWFPIIGVTLVSLYGQLYNQLDDFDVDRDSGLKNTAILIGRLPSKVFLYAALAAAIMSGITSIFVGAFPGWLAPIAVVVGFTLLLFRWNHDMRGNQTDASGMTQKPALILFNVVMLIWVVGELGLLSGLFIA